MKELFTEVELEEIKRAVAGAEARTSGEIVPYIVDRSDRYDVTLWRGAAIFAILAICFAGATYRFYEGWGMAWVYSGQGMAFLVLCAGVIGALLGGYVPALKRMLAGQGHLARVVHHRAMRAFVEEEVFNTRDRTGILLFISMLEHRIEVLGDEGINRRVSADDWADVVASIRTGIKTGKVAEGLINAIDICGKLLERKGVEIKPDDADELSNEVRFSDDG